VVFVDYGYLVEKSFSYAWNGLVGSPVKWLGLLVLSLLQVIPVIGFVIFLIFSGVNAANVTSKIPLLVGGFLGAIICMLIFNAFYQGFLVRILRGEESLPDISDPAALFMDGIKFTLVQVIYFLPVLLVILGILFVSFTTLSTGNAFSSSSTMMTLMVIILAGLLVAGILAIIISFFYAFGIIRFARTGSISQAFEFGEILAAIGKIGWGSYIIALLILFATILVYAIGISIVQTLFSMIPVIGVLFYLAIGLVQIILNPLIACYLFRYLSMVYDTPGSA
jgi:hypothetical protein